MGVRSFNLYDALPVYKASVKIAHVQKAILVLPITRRTKIILSSLQENRSRLQVICEVKILFDFLFIF
jgi:hypothetical protein